MTDFMKRGFWLAAVAALLFVPGVEAETFIILNGRDVDLCSVRRGGTITPVASNVSVDSALNAIRIQANGSAVEIHFDSLDDGLYIGQRTVRIERRRDISPSWGDVTVTGFVISTAPAGSGTIYLSADTGTFNVKIAGKISVGDGREGDAVQVGAGVALRMDACTLSAGTGYALRYINSGADGVLEINGGKFTSVRGHAVYRTDGTTKISGGWFESGSGYAVRASNLTITGGSFKSTSGNYAILANSGLNINGGQFVSAKSAVYSTGAFKIVGGEFVAGSGHALRVSGDGEIRGGSFKATNGGGALLVAGGNVLVTGGAEFVNNSEANPTIQLSGGSVRLADADVTNNNRINRRAVHITSASGRLVLSGPNPPYLSGSIISRFAGAIITDSSFNRGVNRYTLELTGGACVDGAVAVVGGAAHYNGFDYSGTYYELGTKDDDIVVNLKQGVETPNYVVTGDTATGFVALIERGTAGNLIIGRGTIIGNVMDSIRINAGGRPCNIRFGDGRSVLDAGRVNGVRFVAASDGPVWGRVTLTGKMSNAKSGVRGNSYALLVSGGVSVESRLDNPSAVGHFGSVYVDAESEYIHSGGDLCGLIRNNGGTVTMTGGTVPRIDNMGGGWLEVTGGAVGSDTLSGYAINNAQSGRTVISGNTEITTASPNGAVYIGADAYLYLYGGIVSSLAAVNGDSAAKAIVVYEGDGSKSAGRLEMCGSPAVDGTISLSVRDGFPIKISAGDGYVFNPPRNEIYRVAISASDSGVVVENGAGFFYNFALDVAGNAGLKLAVDANDLVAAKKTCNISFSLNGSLGNPSPPDDILVVKGGTVSDKLKPSTDEYISRSGYYNDGKWYVRTGISADGDQMSTPFRFSDEGGGASVDADMVLTLFWTDIRAIAIRESTRDIPVVRNAETAAITPIVSSSGSLTAGPSPVSGSVGAVNFFRSGTPISNGKLFIYDASGNIVTTVIVNDRSGISSRRSVASWKINDDSVRPVANGTYVARGVVTTKAGKTERVSVLINVQK